MNDDLWINLVIGLCMLGFITWYLQKAKEMEIKK